jgi:hypothetical protein
MKKLGDEKLGEEMGEKKSPKKSEHLEQAEFVSWFRREFPGVRIFAIPNGGQRSIAQAASLKVEGVTKGVPDLYVPLWALWIEMKAVGGKMSIEQKNWHKYLTEVCFDDYILAFGCDDAIQQLKKIRKII